MNNCKVDGSVFGIEEIFWSSLNKIPEICSGFLNDDDNDLTFIMKLIDYIRSKDKIKNLFMVTEMFWAYALKNMF